MILPIYITGFIVTFLFLWHSTSIGPDFGPSIFSTLPWYIKYPTLILTSIFWPLILILVIMDIRDIPKRKKIMRKFHEDLDM